MRKFSEEEIDEVTDFLIGFDEDKEVECDFTEREELSINRFAIEWDLIREVVSELLKNIDLGVSPLTCTPFIGITEEKDAFKQWIAKDDIQSDFINNILQFMQAEKITKEKKAVEREILNAGQKEYTITVRKH